ncbi:glycosyltransferase [candidate division WWE3 bacterium]|nr:glycosyltransferase [candidate division WWE3 bacterium]
MSAKKSNIAEKTPPFKILIVGAEVAPYATVGGFSAVLAYLSRELKALGHDVRLFMPKYGFIDEDEYETKMLHEGLKVPTDDETNKDLICNVKYTKNDHDVITYFLENKEYYEKRANVYSYVDDPTRFALLSRGAIEFIRTEEFVPDIIHTNDWHTGILANYLRTSYRKDPILKDIATAFTIHNLRYQGNFDHKNVSELDYDDGKSAVSPFFSPRLNNLNFMRRGILFNDVVNTVSKTYAREILTPEYGEGLDKLLMEVRGKLFGIVNGLDYDEFDPMKDNLVEHPFDIDHLDDRIKNKACLQREFDLPVDEDALLFGFVGRLDYQKGVDLIVNTLRHVFPDYNVQFVQVGGGDRGLTEMLKALKRDFPDQVGIHPLPNFTLPRMVFAGSDCILYPSRFEPCGIVQIESMRYGAIPVVRKVGGLADTVRNFDTLKQQGTGFVFTNFDQYSLFGQIARAYELYKNKEVWQALQKNAMKADFSWEYSAKEYEKLYERAISFKHKDNPHVHKVEDLVF